MKRFPRVLTLALFLVAICSMLFAQEPPAAPAPPVDVTTTDVTTTDTAAVAQEPTAEAVQEVPADTVAADEAETATVIIYRVKSFVGMALHPTVMLDGADLINVANGTVWQGSFKPGHYLFEMDDKKSKADIDLVKGETYYMLVSLVPGMWKGGGKLTQVTAEQGEAASKNLRPLPEDEIEHAMFKATK